MRTIPCKKCGSLEFYAHGGCKPCAKKRASEWYKNNTEIVKNRAYEWGIKNPEKMAKCRANWLLRNIEKAKKDSAEWKRANPDKVRKAVKKYADRNTEKISKKSAEYHAANKEEINARHRKYCRDNPHLFRIYAQNRIARKKMSSGVLSVNLAEKLFKLQNGKCACCGLPLGEEYHLDHIMPLALGGTNEDWNIQLLKAECNLSKHAKHPIDFMQSKGFLL